jgi:benzoyl-CoA reductase/2-hydroxyglutaryl-CoA dehydratase subunit BcrC/BadD/HgdB
MVLAAGAVPVRLGGAAAADHDRERAASLLGAVDPAFVELLAGILAAAEVGMPDLLGIVCSRDREASLRVFYVLRELRAGGAPLPPVHLVDLVHLPRAETLRYNVSQLDRLADVLAGWTGHDPRGAALLRAVTKYTTVRELLAEVQEARVRGTVSGSEALGLFRAAATLAPDTSIDSLRAALAQAAVRTPDERRRIYLTGSAHDEPSLYRAIEARGWAVVGEDHDRGALALTVALTAADVAEEGLLAVARAYRDRGPDSATAAAAERAAYTDVDAEAAGASGVLDVVRVHDEAPLWDLPALRDRLCRRGVPLVLLRDQGLDVDAAALDTALAELAETALAGAAR